MISPRLLARSLPILFLLLALAAAWLQRSPAESGGEVASTGVSLRFGRADSGEMVEVKGRVVRLLADDRAGSRHQRFILELAGGQTLLIAHNIDLAPRVPLVAGGRVAVRGQYEWNERGGVLHWTHGDPAGRRRDTGWIEYEGRVYR